LVVRELIKQGASVKMVTIGGWHPLHHAIFGGHIDATAELLEADVEVDVRLDDSGPDDGMTPLHLAASLGHTAIVAMLLECGADFFLVTSNVSTFLDSFYSLLLRLINIYLSIYLS
jgi:ankyrin repeat protein